MIGTGVAWRFCYIKNVEAATVPRIYGHWYSHGGIGSFSIHEGTEKKSGSASSAEFGTAVTTGVSLTTEANAAIAYGPVTAGGSVSSTASIDFTVNKVKKYSTTFGRSTNSKVVKTCAEKTGKNMWVWEFIGEYKHSIFATKVGGTDCAYTISAGEHPRCLPGYCVHDTNCQQCHSDKEGITQTIEEA